MRIRPGTVFVLGAGASVPYGLPTGLQLTRDVLSRCREGTFSEKVLEALDDSNSNLSTIREMGRRIRACMPITIDAWVGASSDSQKFSRLAKAMIAGVLLLCEARQRARTLPSSKRDSDWLGTLLNGACCNLGEPAPIRMITFNFDRLVEWRAMEFYAGLLGDKHQVYELANSVAPLHVSGRLGLLDWEPEWSAQRGVDFQERDDASLQVEDLRKATAQIQFVFEDRAKSDLNDARLMISTAPLVVFLGFGFHPKNLDALDPRGNRHVRFVGTAMDRTSAEMREIEADCGRQIDLKQCDALTLLRTERGLHGIPDDEILLDEDTAPERM